MLRWLPLTALVACSGDETDSIVPIERVWQSHGEIAPNISSRMGDVIPSATDEQRATFERGLAVATRRFSLEDGLGPGFNVTFCAACHEKPDFGGSAGLYRNFAIGAEQTDDGVVFPGDSAGNESGVVRVYYYGHDYPARPPVATDVEIIAQRNAIPFFGVGLLAELTEEEILSRADEFDADGDGISGRPNYEEGFVGRFGLKAQTVSIEGFIRGPLSNHLGVTTDPLCHELRAALPVDSSSADDEPCADSSAALNLDWMRPGVLPYGQAAAQSGPITDADDAPDPELSVSDLFDLVSYAMLLGAPAVEDISENQSAKNGQLLFDDMGCGDCHTPRLDSPRGPLPIYSDLLLHDMGEELDDGLRIAGMQNALGSEFRTQPLWGLAAVGPYLHDGRAHTIYEAIDMHGGEAQAGADAFAALSSWERDDVAEFLMSLGGRDQLSPGLVPPDDPLRAVGEYGGPVRALSADEEERFLAGRELFDFEFGFSDGAGGPRFNGDSCRACHFEPVIGGSGPRGVNVMRHGITSGDAFTSPNVGTILHKQTRDLTDVVRAQDAADIFEHRQTPALFGLGLIDDLDEAVITASADPDDTESPDGITGRVSWTDGGQVGRFGWKAQVPSLTEFVRDAVSAEFGMTLDYEEGLTFGAIQDNDDVPDPEFAPEDAELLADFMRMLGPPPRTSTDAAAEAAGEDVFVAVGCDGCHTPSLEGPEGPVELYSDLLLHEVLPEGESGIEEASAGEREFRTAPLWGLAVTGPYLHDGSADTIVQAIEGHAGEATGVVEAYQALSEADRAALNAFLESL